MKQFSMILTAEPTDKPEVFTEDDAPTWLKTPESRRHSTMDNLWFWEGHVLTLPVGGVVETDFRTITRIH